MTETVFVLGGGVAGLSAARNLQMAGRPVAIIDPLPSPGGASYGNGGFISPESFMPSAQPGMLRNVPRWLGDPLGPLAITPGQMIRSMPWFMKWLKAGKLGRMTELAGRLRSLHAPALDEWRRMLGPDLYGRYIKEEGEVILADETPSGPVFETEQRLCKEYGLSVDILSKNDLRRLYPGMSDVVQYGVLKPGNAHTVSPAQVNAALADRIAADGGTFISERVLKLIPDGEGWLILTNVGNYRARDVVVACGVWSNQLLKPLGADVPLESLRGYHVMLPANEVEIGIPFIHRGRGIGLTPMLEGLRVAGTIEFSGVDGVPNEKRADQALHHARQLFPGIKSRPETVWTGQRPATPDTLPAVGRVLGRSGLWLCFGHGAYGMTSAPATGRVIAELLTGRKTFIAAESLEPGRFR